MKTLLELTENSAKYEFISGTTQKIFTISKNLQITDDPIKLDFEVIAETEYKKWIEWFVYFSDWW